MKLGLVAALITALAACEALSGAGGRPAGTRRVDMNLPTELIESMGSQLTGLQLAAVVVRADGSYGFHVSPAIDPAAASRVSGYWPVDESYVLVVQTQSSGATSGPGRLLALVQFNDGLGAVVGRVPSGENDLDLGTPGYEPAGTTAVAALRVADANNPLARIDSDADGIHDLADDDDDEDGTADAADEDRDGDGTLDADQALAALEDGDADGIPDIFE